MILHIDDYMRVGDLQDKFSLCFPDMEVRFYDEESTIEDHPERQITALELLENIRSTHQHGELEIKSWFTGGSVEREFKDKFGLTAAIFRKCAGNWWHLADKDQLVTSAKRPVLI